MKRTKGVRKRHNKKAAAEREERLEITLHGLTEMVSFKCGGTEALLCPMRPPKEYLQNIAEETESKAG